MCEGTIAQDARVTLSSRLQAKDPILPTDFTDGSRTTCGRTRIEHDPWITVHLDNTYVLEDIVLRQDPFYRWYFYKTYMLSQYLLWYMKYGDVCEQ